MSSDWADLHVRQVRPAATKPLDGDPAHVVLEHPDTRLRYRLNPSSVFIWRLLSEESRFDVLAARVASEFGLGAEEAEEGLRAFIDRLGPLGFVSIDDGSREAKLRARYLDLLKAALVNAIYPEHELRIEWLEQHGPQPDGARQMRDIRYAQPDAFADLLAHKADGRVRRREVTRFSHTMVGLRRLQNLEWCAAQIFREGIEGDFLEAGVCQGGASIFLRALQVAYGQEHRRTWVADSFEGLPEPTSEFDQGYDLHEAVQPWLSTSLEAVRDNFRTYDLLSGEVTFLPGWFSESLPRAPVEDLSILRADADLYASTREVLESLYDKVVPGGFVIIDDYHVFPNCRRAVDEFRAERGIADPLIRIDWTAVFWRKS